MVSNALPLRNPGGLYGRRPLPPRLDSSPEFGPRLTKSSANPQVFVNLGLFVGHAVRIGDRSARFAACEIILNKLRRQPNHNQRLRRMLAIASEPERIHSA